MAITDEQRRSRALYIGSSDAPAIVGVDPWRTAADVWAEKTGKLKPKKDDNDAAKESGTFLEPAVLGFAEAKTGKILQRNLRLVHPDGLRAANLDGFFPSFNEHGDPAICEAKAPGIMNFGAYLGEWGAPGTDQVPDYVVVQVQHQMDVASGAMEMNVRMAVVPVLLVGVGFALFYVRHSDRLSAEIKEAEEEFWMQYVKTDTPPPDSIPSMETIKRFVRPEGKTVRLDYQKVIAWMAAKERKKIADHDEEELKRAMLADLGDAEYGECYHMPIGQAEFELAGVLSYRAEPYEGYSVPPGVKHVPRWKSYLAADKKKRRKTA